ncbi:MAG TPA: cytochrome c [Candidatus Binatia bacterium]|nr:cytochrome c [Candidatus Binatia bacterium]
MIQRKRTRTSAALIAGALLCGGTGVARADDGKAAYDKNCVTCHGASGKGDGPAAKALKPPPGDFATSLKGMSDADMVKLLKEGGKPLGKTHSAFAAKLNDEQINAVVTYIKGLK